MIVRQTETDRVRSVDLFRDVSVAHFSQLVKSASLQRVPARTLLFKEGARPAVLHTLIEGSVELFSEHHARRCTIAVIRSVKPFVLTSIVSDRNSVSARTLAPSLLLLVPAKLVHELIETDPGFACAATRELAGDHRDLIEDVKNQKLQTALERLAQWMLRSSEHAGGAEHFALPYDKRTLASYLGMTPEHLSRNLAALTRAGVTVHGRQVTLKDRPALAAVAHWGER
jgi:CRP/FNR family transcriptional regulator, transcriptional activator FtrB